MNALSAVCSRYRRPLPPHNEWEDKMSFSAPNSALAPSAARFSGPQGLALTRAFAAARETLRVWRSRARERAELAVMDRRERRDLPHARDFDIRGETAKPFWRA